MTFKLAEWRLDNCSQQLITSFMFVLPCSICSYHQRSNSAEPIVSLKQLVLLFLIYILRLYTTFMQHCWTCYNSTKINLKYRVCSLFTEHYFLIIQEITRREPVVHVCTATVLQYVNIRQCQYSWKVFKIPLSLQCIADLLLKWIYWWH